MQITQGRRILISYLNNLLLEDNLNLHLRLTEMKVSLSETKPNIKW